MASRGSEAKNGHVTTDEYSTESVTENGVKILKGNGRNHSLPDYSHSPNSVYAKLKKDGTLHEMRFYDSKGNPVLEIAHHGEPNLNRGNKDPIVHYHTYDGLARSPAARMTGEIKEKYAKYLKEFDLYDKC